VISVEIRDVNCRASVERLRLIAVNAMQLESGCVFQTDENDFWGST